MVSNCKTFHKGRYLYDIPIPFFFFFHVYIFLYMPAGAKSRTVSTDIVVSGDGCQSIADKYRITLANFIRWNSGVGNDCKSLWLQTYACVGII